MSLTETLPAVRVSTCPFMAGFRSATAALRRSWRSLSEDERYFLCLSMSYAANGFEGYNPALILALTKKES